MSLNDVMKFWGKDSKATKMVTAKKTFQPYELPIVETEEGTNAFEYIASEIIRVHSDIMVDTGYILLDDLWANSTDETIKNYRDQIGLEAYPKPFCGRRVYLIKIGLKETEKTTDDGLVKEKTIHSLSSYVDKKDKSDRFRFSGYVSVFQNKELGYNNNAVDVVKKEANEKGEIVEVEVESPTQLMFTSFFMSSELFKDKILSYVKDKIDEDPEIDGVFCYAIGGYVKKGDLKDKLAPPEHPLAKDYWYSMSVDDVVLL